MRAIDRLRYALTRKHFTGGLGARARLVWHMVIRGYSCEVCGRCGRPVALVWWCPDDALWRAVNGQEGGTMCLTCFDQAAAEIRQPQRYEARPL